MGIFNFSEKNYASIVAPLNQIESDLSVHIGNQQNNISGLKLEKEVIETKIGDANLEILKSENTVVKIADLLSFDLDNNGIADVNQLPETEESTE